MERLLAEFKVPAQGVQAPGAIVLRELDGHGQAGEHGRYVTHFRNDQDKGYHHGHYFDATQQQKAWADFKQRCAEQGYTGDPSLWVLGAKVHHSSGHSFVVVAARGEYAALRADSDGLIGAVKFTFEDAEPFDVLRTDEGDYMESHHVAGALDFITEHEKRVAGKSYYDGTGHVTGHSPSCKHAWQEVEDEPPYDTCTSCGARRE